MSWSLHPSVADWIGTKLLPSIKWVRFPPDGLLIVGPVAQSGSSATLIRWSSLVQIQPGLLCAWCSGLHVSL